MAELDLARIKRNVGRMIDQGAPDDEIESYVREEGATPDAVRAFKPHSPDVGVDMAKGLSYGFNEGLDATLNMIGALPRGAVNLAARALGYDDVIPELHLARRANDPTAYIPIPGSNEPIPGFTNEGAGPAETTAGRTVQAVGEAVGASAVPTAGALTAGRVMSAAPGILSAYAQAPRQAAALDAVASVGGGLGVATARENDLGPTAEIGLGLAGGFALPNAANLAARTYGGALAAGQYANRMVERARSPEIAAYRDIADQGVRAGFDFGEAMNAVTPPRSGNLQRRGFTQQDLADIISRQLQGENAEDIIGEYAHLVDARGRPATAATARNYLRLYQEQNPTPMNLLDLAKEQLNSPAIPLARQVRADMAISDDPVAGDRLILRQREQPGRVADIVQQSTLDGRYLEDELTRLATTARDEERAAYDVVRQQEQPVELGDVLRTARGRAQRRGGELSDKVNEAVDLFFEPELRQTPQSPMGALRLTEAEERVQDAIAREASPERIARLERRLAAMREQDIESRPMREVDVGTPIRDVSRFIDARSELGQMIERSMQDGRPTPLTAELTALRTRLNAAARSNNDALTQADARFSENRSIDRILQRGRDLGKKLTPQTRQALRDFRDMTPTQQEAMRVSFEDQLASDALGVRRGLAAADQFNSEAFDLIVERLYPQSAGRAVHERGQRLLRNLKREAITTATTRDALSGSRTAPLQDDIAALMEGPRAAADLITGRWSRLLENLSNRLTREIGQAAATERVRILTQTDPAQLLQVLGTLAREARTSSERQAYVTALRQFRRVGRRPAAELGVVNSVGYGQGE
jgi:hypothetical protein